MKTHSRPVSPRTIPEMIRDLSRLTLLLICISLLVSCNARNHQTGVEIESIGSEIAAASAVMEAASGSQVTGQAALAEENGKVRFQSVGRHGNSAMKTQSKRGGDGSY